MDILSRFYRVDMRVLHIEGCDMGPVKNCQAMKRIFLLDDGIDYDSVILSGFGADGVRQVAVGGSIADTKIQL
jgi:hypothetical protein